MIFNSTQAKELYERGRLRVRVTHDDVGGRFIYGDPVPAGLDINHVAQMLSVGYYEPDDRPLLQQPRSKQEVKPQAKPLPPPIAVPKK